MHTKFKLNNAELFLKLFFYTQSKEIRNKKYYEEKEENLKNVTVRFCLSIDIRKEKTHS